MKNNRYTNWFFAAAVVVAGFSMAACEDEPDKYEVAGGKPTLKYVRVPDPAAADSLLTGAYMASKMTFQELSAVCRSVRICGVFTSSISMTRRRYLIPVTSLTIHLW